MKKLLMALLVLSLVGCSSKATVDNTPVESGTITDNAYVNESIDLRVDLPATMRFATDEETKMFLEIGGQVIDENLEDGQELTEFYAMGKDYTYNMNLIIAPRGKMSMDQYLKLQEEQFKSLSNDTIQIEILGTTDVEIAGKEWKVLNLTTKFAGTSLRQSVALRMQSDKLITITLTAQSEADLNKMFALIQNASATPNPALETEEAVAGGVVDGVYIDEVFNVKIELPQDMAFNTPTTMGTTVSTDAASTDMTKAIQVIVQDSMSMTAEQYITVAETYLKDSESDTYTVEIINKDSVQFAGEKWPGLTAKVVNNGVEVYLVAAVKVEGNRAMEIICGSTSLEQTKDLLQYINVAQ